MVHFLAWNLTTFREAFAVRHQVLDLKQILL